jgi:hypothetical protein
VRVQQSSLLASAHRYLRPPEPEPTVTLRGHPAPNKMQNPYCILRRRGLNVRELLRVIRCEHTRSLAGAAAPVCILIFRGGLLGRHGCRVQRNWRIRMGHAGVTRVVVTRFSGTLVERPVAGHAQSAAFVGC